MPPKARVSLRLACLKTLKLTNGPFCRSRDGLRMMGLLALLLTLKGSTKYDLGCRCVQELLYYPPLPVVDVCGRPAGPERRRIYRTTARAQYATGPSARATCNIPSSQFWGCWAIN